LFVYLIRNVLPDIVEKSSSSAIVKHAIHMHSAVYDVTACLCICLSVRLSAGWRHSSNKWGK